MRLVDADDFIVGLEKYIDKPMTAGLCATLIEAQPTAYDIEKVVEQLEELQQYYIYSIDDLVRLKEVKEILKRGGAND